MDRDNDSCSSRADDSCLFKAAAASASLRCCCSKTPWLSRRRDVSVSSSASWRLSSCADSRSWRSFCSSSSRCVRIALSSLSSRITSWRRLVISAFCTCTLSSTSFRAICSEANALRARASCASSSPIVVECDESVDSAAARRALTSSKSLLDDSRTLLVSSALVSRESAESGASKSSSKACGTSRGLPPKPSVTALVPALALATVARPAPAAAASGFTLLVFGSSGVLVLDGAGAAATAASSKGDPTSNLLLGTSVSSSENKSR